MLCKIMSIAYESIQNNNLLKILLALKDKRKYTNTANVYAGKQQQILQILNANSGMYFEKYID